MPELFISYRREDSSGHAGRLFDCMRERFGDEAVFMDVTDIRPGVDFAVALDTALSSCRVVLVVIGKQWLTCSDASGRRRLDDPGDHLRMEVAQALGRRDAHVIPVLVRGAAMPSERGLPEDLRPLARRQAHEVSDSRWSHDTEQLVRIVENDLGTPGQDAVVARTTQSTKAVAAGIGWTRIAILAAVVFFGLIVSRMWSGSGARDGTFNAQSSNDAAASRALKGTSPENPPARLPASREVRAGHALYKVLGGLVSREAGGPHTVRLFVRITNVGGAYGFNVTFDSFRLIVQGQAIPPDAAPIEAIAMQSATESWVTFQVPLDAAAVLQVGDIREATAKIPIDLGAAAPDVTAEPAPTWRYPADIGATFEKRVGALLFNIDGIRLEHFADAVDGLQPEKLQLSIKIRMKNVGLQQGYAVSGNDFRLLIEDVPWAPTKFPIEVLTYQAGLDTEVVFAVPGTATKAILQLGNVTAETVRVEVDLSPALQR